MDFIVSHWEVWFSAIPPVLTLWLLKTVSNLIKKQQLEKKREHEEQEHLKEKRELEKQELYRRQEIQEKKLAILTDTRENLETEMENFRNILIAIAHDRLYQSCNFFIDRKCITSSELKNLEFLYTAYHAIGGNGTGTDLYNKCRKLELKPTMVD